MASYDEEEELIRFPCEECGKMLGAVPGMRIVVCPKCQLDNTVPNQVNPTGSLADAAFRPQETNQPQEVQIISVDVPLPVLMRFGVKVALASIPLVCVLALATCGVMAIGSVIRDSPTPAVTVPPESPPITIPNEAVPPEASLPSWVAIAGVWLLVCGTLGVGVFCLWMTQESGERNGRLSETIILVVFCLGPFFIGARLCWWYFR